MDFWNRIYDQFDPVAFHLFSLPVHWYGIMYILALVSALYGAKWYVRHDHVAIETKTLDAYFIWVEIGVILGARIGYVTFYDPDVLNYLTQPWQIFNPYKNGEFVGIRGMSYHGAVIGFFVASYLFSRRRHVNFGRLMDIVAVAVPMGYIFGRIGNFLNQELVGRATEAPIGIYVNGVLRHPSQLYEALLEGVGVFLTIWLYRNHKKFEGELILLYGFAYGVMRFTAEFWRQPDPQLGFICCGWMTMGQLLSIVMMAVAATLWPIFYARAKKRTAFNA